MLFDDLKKANLMAMKNKDMVAKGILPVVINKAMLLNIELKAKNQEMVDADVLNIIQKAIKELDDEILAFTNANRAEKAEELKAQQDYLRQYLPKQLTAEEIREEIAKLADRSVPSVMKHFKANFNGQCDMKLVNTVAKEFN